MELLGGVHHMERATRAPVGDPVWQPRMRHAVAQLKVAFAEHMDETEGPSGFYAGVLHDAPRLAQYLNALVDHHRTVWTELDELDDRLREPLAVEDLRERADHLLLEVWQHRQRGADLLYEAYETDLGGET